MSSHQTAIDRQLFADGLLRCGPWTCTHDDDALIDHAKAQARAVEQDAAAVGELVYAYQRAVRRVEAHHLSEPQGVSLRGSLARMSCDLWWRRQLRRLSGRRLEQRERVLGRVNKRAGIYVSNLGYERRREQTTRNAMMLEAMTATNQHGQEYTLAELSELGLANPNNRRAELMLRIADTEREASRLGHVGVFLTITCPSRFHAVHHTARMNAKYQGADPREAQAYLQKLWSKARAALGRKRLGVYGIRVVEPHHDGTPHWHLLLWCEPQNAGAVLGLLRGYALEDTPEEVTRRESVRFDAKLIDTNRGSAAGYVAKYISKNINGSQFAEADHYGNDLRDSAPRIEAWAATWGIRQFQFFGLPSVTVWRQARRIRDAADLLEWIEDRELPAMIASGIWGPIWKAADSGDWARYLYLMGGPMTKRADQPVRPWSIQRLRGQGGECQTGRYGEPLASVVGVVVDGVECMTKRHFWTVERKGGGSDFDLESLNFDAAGGAWTRVNNCTPRPEKSPLDEWEWHITESFRRMKPIFDPATVADIHRQTAADAFAAQKADALRRAERQDERERRRRVEEGENMIINWLANGHITETDALEALTA